MTTMNTDKSSSGFELLLYHTIEIIIIVSQSKSLLLYHNHEIYLLLLTVYCYNYYGSKYLVNTRLIRFPSASLH